MDRTGENDRQVGWHADPFGRHGHRWWDGLQWTERVRTAQQMGIDPARIEVAPSSAASPGPARPIEDALLPISRRPTADKVSVAVACLVFLALTAVFVVALMT